MSATSETQTQTRNGATSPLANVLCAIDGKDGGYAAVAQAAALAGSRGHLTLLEVTSFRTDGGRRGPAILPGEAAAILKRAEAIATDAGVQFASEVDPASPPAKVILEWSTRYDLLALGSPATSSIWAGLLSAGVGDKALNAPTTPLLIARPLPDAARFAERLVVASDGTDASDTVVELAAQIARVHRSSLLLVHALGHEAPVRRSRLREHERRIEQQREGLERELGANAVEVRLTHGHAHDLICSAAESSDASLVVMGSRGREGLRAIGSVSRRVAHEASCSVLLVAPPVAAL